MRYVLFFLIITVGCGCTYHFESEETKNPVSYQQTPYRSKKSIGLLRRLVIMPIVHEPYKDEYKSFTDQKAAAQKFQDACVKYLSNDKGYEIIVINDLGGKWIKTNLEINDREECKEKADINHLYQLWHSEKAGKHSEQVIKKISNELNVDGVVVIRVKEVTGWSVFDGILNIALMNAPLFYNLATPNIGAWIYEGASGQLVMSIEQSTWGDPDSAPSISQVVNLFVDMENAVPSQLTK